MTLEGPFQSKLSYGNYLIQRRHWKISFIIPYFYPNVSSFQTHPISMFLFSASACFALLAFFFPISTLIYNLNKLSIPASNDIFCHNTVHMVCTMPIYLPCLPRLYSSTSEVYTSV